jgi:mannose-1-phosphate guanylyltransferase
MQALVLVGGEGTRLRPLTDRMPKPAVPLVDRPFISYMVEWLASHGVDDIVLACGFLPDRLREVLGEGEDGGPRIRYLAEPEPRGTAGAIRFAADLLDERFLALNGDTLTDLDLTALMRAHEERGARATLGLYPVDDPSAYGLVRRGEDDAVLEFLEKPSPEVIAELGIDEINAGAYVLERSVLDLIAPDKAVSIEREVFPQMVGSGLYGLRLDGYWMDIGTPERYLQASWDILEGRVRTGVLTDDRGVQIAPGASVSPGAEVGPRAVVADGCEIGDGAKVTETVALAGSSIGAGATVTRTILSPGAKVASGAIIDGAVIGEGETAK